MYYFARFNQAVSSNSLVASFLNTKQNLALSKHLYTHGYLNGYQINKKNNTLLIFLKYYNNQPVIQLLKPISTKKNKIAYTLKQLKLKYLRENRIYILSSSNSGFILSTVAIALGTGGIVMYELCI